MMIEYKVQFGEELLICFMKWYVTVFFVITILKLKTTMQKTVFKKYIKMSSNNGMK